MLTYIMTYLAIGFILFWLFGALFESAFPKSTLKEQVCIAVVGAIVWPIALVFVVIYFFVCAAKIINKHVKLKKGEM